MSSPTTLSSRWRALAEQMRSLGAVAQATTLEHCADDLDETLRIWQTEPLTLEEAVEAQRAIVAAILVGLDEHDAGIGRRAHLFRDGDLDSGFVRCFVR